MTIATLTVKSGKDETLSSLYREIAAKFPNLDDFVDSFLIVEGKKAFFAAGDPVVKEIEIIWHISEPDSKTLVIMQQVVDLINSSGQGSVHIDYAD